MIQGILIAVGMGQLFFAVLLFASWKPKDTAPVLWLTMVFMASALYVITAGVALI